MKRKRYNLHFEYKENEFGEYGLTKKKLEKWLKKFPDAKVIEYVEYNYTLFNPSCPSRSNGAVWDKRTPKEMEAIVED